MWILFAVLNVNFSSKDENWYFNIRPLGNPFCTEHSFLQYVVDYVREKVYCITDLIAFITPGQVSSLRFKISWILLQRLMYPLELATSMKTLNQCCWKNSKIHSGLRCSRYARFYCHLHLYIDAEASSAQPWFIKPNITACLPSHFWIRFSLCWSSTQNLYFLKNENSFSVIWRRALTASGGNSCVDGIYYFLLTQSKCFDSVLQDEKYFGHLTYSNVQHDQQNYTLLTQLNVNSEVYLLGNTPNSFVSYMFSSSSPMDR